MTTRTDGDDGDDPGGPQLRSMRAVWLSMRDEEPPAAGLTELLAAARAKAEAMRPREPWWQRALAALRRPPVLALATVVVLLGGAVAIGTRRDELTARPQAAREIAAVDSAEEARGRGDGMADGKLVAPAEPAKDSAGAAAAPAPSSAGAAAAPVIAPEPAAPRAAGSVAPAPVVRRPARPEAPRGAASGPGGAQDALAKADAEGERGEAPQVVTGAAKPATEPAAQPSPPPPPPPSPADVRPQGSQRPGGGQRLQIADDAGGGRDPQQLDSESIETTGRAPAAPDAGRPRAPTAAQLVKQSETAAARGDCAAVRAIAARLRTLDPAAYKAHVGGNAAVRRCLK